MSRVASESLVAVARILLDRPDAVTAGWWPRAAALLARQALEQALQEYWREQDPDMERASGRAQFLCLKHYLSDSTLAGSAHLTWEALSDACHHHPYQLSPTSKELRNWLDTTECLIQALRKT